MSIPKYHEFMLPILVHLKDGTEKTISELKTGMEDKFKLSEAEIKKLLPSGTQPIFDNRIGDDAKSKWCMCVLQMYYVCITRKWIYGF